MRTGLIISLALHGGILVWAVAEFTEPRTVEPVVERPVPIEIVPASEITRVKAGTKTGEPDKLGGKPEAEPEKPKTDAKKPEPKKPEPKKVVPERVVAAAPPPLPPVEQKPEPAKIEPPKPVEPAKPVEQNVEAPKVEPVKVDPPKPVEPKVEEPKAEAPKVEPVKVEPPKPAEPKPEEKKPEPPKPEEKKPEPVKAPAPVRKPEPPKQVAKAEPKKPEPAKPADARPAQPDQNRNFDADRIAALLNKIPNQPRTIEQPLPVAPQEGPAGRGQLSGRDATMSVNEIDAFRQQISRCWVPPTGGLGADKIVVRLKLQLKEDGSLQGPPRILNSSSSSFFQAAADSAVRAVWRCQPYQLPAEKYDTWRDMVLNFDPREMFGG